MTNDNAQLADILVDWCGADLDSDNFVGESQVKVAATMLKCMLFTMSNDQTARELFIGLLADAVAAARRD